MLFVVCLFIDKRILVVLMRLRRFGSRLALEFGACIGWEDIKSCDIKALDIKKMSGAFLRALSGPFGFFTLNPTNLW
jgi:hypothetical protein